MTDFLSRFATLKNRCANLPDNLREMATSDPSVIPDCQELYLTAHKLHMIWLTHISSNPEFEPIRPVPFAPGFLGEWKDYCLHYNNVLYQLVVDSTAKVGDEASFTYDEHGIPGMLRGDTVIPVSPTDFGWEGLWIRTRFQESYHSLFLLFIECLLHSSEEGIDSYFAQMSERYKLPAMLDVETALEYMDMLNMIDDFPIEHVARRKTVFPYIDPLSVKPRSQAGPFGFGVYLRKAEGHFELGRDARAHRHLLILMDQARNACVYAAPTAAFSLMRSIMVMVLRDHYVNDDDPISGPDWETDDDLENQYDSLDTAPNLGSLIDNASNLPSGVTKERLHTIRNILNAPLHPEGRNDPRVRGFFELDLEENEKEVASMFHTLHTLIDGIGVDT